jgi:hypothetical protein
MFDISMKYSFGKIVEIKNNPLPGGLSLSYPSIILIIPSISSMPSNPLVHVGFRADDICPNCPGKFFSSRLFAGRSLSAPDNV